MIEDMVELQRINEIYDRIFRFFGRMARRRGENLEQAILLEKAPSVERRVRSPWGYRPVLLRQLESRYLEAILGSPLVDTDWGQEEEEDRYRRVCFLVSQTLPSYTGQWRLSLVFLYHWGWTMLSIYSISSSFSNSTTLVIVTVGKDW